MRAVAGALESGCVCGVQVFSRSYVLMRVDWLQLPAFITGVAVVSAASVCSAH